MPPFPHLETPFASSMEQILPPSMFQETMLEMYFNNFSLLLRDRDQDKYSGNCGQLYRAGWWHNKCNQAQPTGLSTSTKTSGLQLKYINWYFGGQRGNIWDTWPEASYVLVPN